MNPAPSSNHQLAFGRLFHALYGAWTARGALVFAAPYDVLLGDDTVVQPDILVVTPERRSIMGDARIVGAPDLVVEILSPSSRKLDCTTKRALYAKYGVREYWIVDPDAERVEVYVLEGGDLVVKELVCDGELRTHAVMPGFRMNVRDVFAA